MRNVLTFISLRKQAHGAYVHRVQREADDGVPLRNLSVFDIELFDFNAHENMEHEITLFRSPETAEKLFRCLLSGAQREAFFWRENDTAPLCFTSDWGRRLMNRTILTLKQEMVQSAIGFNIQSVLAGRPTIEPVRLMRPLSLSYLHD